MNGRECTFKLRMDAIPILTCSNRFVILIENASVLTLNHTSGLFCFAFVIYIFMVKQSTFLIENELEGIRTHGSGSYVRLASWAWFSIERFKVVTKRFLYSPAHI